ncbi:filamentous hemagglutinin N-terminal domain-containing protein [Actinobacillus indolicus]|uniref:Filamentous hemagglutinin N-terminal domain-containing protein n=1 Tax=Actinobacillus indolicus TaxID=51049 RepID=A0A4P7CHD4_9PAST|nr:filamentous hemagglutinin N-terminal domain-containing protein [Actinobacillus indolicus]QBQ64426.1 filamentous hemagglutinin N-terminal domain-containing protein [Actinobacillus indolicus]
MKEKIYQSNQSVSKSSSIISPNTNVHTSSLKLTPIASLLLLLFSSPSFANGLQGMEVIAGKAHMEVNGVTTTIKNSPNAILNWKSFNINKGDLVQFIQENKNSAVFNKVVSNQLSELHGTLKSNGQVFLRGCSR